MHDRIVTRGNNKTTIQTDRPHRSIIVVVYVIYLRGFSLYEYASGPSEFSITPNSELHEQLKAELLGSFATSPSRMITNLEYKNLVFHAVCTDKLGRSSHIAVFAPMFFTWPGSQPQTVVITDDKLRVTHWEEVGGSPWFVSANLRIETNHLILRVKCDHRSSHYGTYRYKLSLSDVEPVGDVEWIGHE